MKNKYYYDLHIHSCLSPCSDDDMTIRNIIHMAMIKSLDVIAICDHNTTKQLKKAKQYAQGKIDLIYGVEVQTKEGVHILTYFHTDHQIDLFQKYLDKHLIYVKNNQEYYGHQILLDEEDRPYAEEEALLISSVDQSVDEVTTIVKALGGIVVLAHIERKYGYVYVYHQLDFELPFDGIELEPSRVEIYLKQYPQLRDKLIFHNSDAHSLGMMNEPLYSFGDEVYRKIMKENDVCPI